jgi:hypothetical protein
VIIGYYVASSTRTSNPGYPGDATNELAQQAANKRSTWRDCLVRVFLEHARSGSGS